MGRRVFLGLVGLGAAGIVFGAQVQDWLERWSRRSSARTAPGSRRCCRSVASASTRSPATSRSAAGSEYRLKVEGLVDEPFTSRTRDLTRMPPTHVEPRLPVRHRLARSRRRVDAACGSATLLDRAGVKPKATALRFMSFDGTYTESLTLDQARRERCARRVRARGQAAVARARWAGAAVRRADVRLQVVQVARVDRARRRGACPATGSTTATTSTVGSARATAATTSRRE